MVFAFGRGILGEVHVFEADATAPVGFSAKKCVGEVDVCVVDVRRYVCCDGFVVWYAVVSVEAEVLYGAVGFDVEAWDGVVILFGSLKDGETAEFGVKGVFLVFFFDDAFVFCAQLCGDGIIFVLFSSCVYVCYDVRFAVATHVVLF